MARDSEPAAIGHFRLNPKEVSLFDIPKILFSSNLEERKFVEAEGDYKLAAETSSSSLDHFRRSKKKPERLTGYKYYKDSFLFGLLLLITIMIQSFLLFIDKPLYYFESLLQKLLNLLSKARNAFYRLLPGEEFVPENGVNFNEIKQEGGRKNTASLCVMACKASYEYIDDIKTALTDTPQMEFVDYYGFSEARGKATTDAFILVDRSNKEHDTYVLAFRGTEPFNAHEWYIDFDISWYKFGDEIGSIHGGFLEALGLEKDKGYMGQWPKELPHDDEENNGIAYYRLRDKLKKAVHSGNNIDKAKSVKIIITGHSLGGALAILFTATLIMHNESELLKKIDEVYTFGQPRVGDAAFGKYMENKLKQNGIGYYRTVYSYDIVPRLPFDFKEEMYQHFGTCIYYRHHSEFKAVEEVPMENYFSILMAIPKRLDAAFRVIKSLIEGDDGAEVASDIVGIRGVQNRSKSIEPN